MNTDARALAIAHLLRMGYPPSLVQEAMRFSDAGRLDEALRVLARIPEVTPQAAPKGEAQSSTQQTEQSEPQ